MKDEPYDWWKNPVISGPGSEYGQFDYLLKELPQNHSEWLRYPCQCSDCRKDRRLAYHMTAYWRTIDGWDCDTCVTCWRCFLKEKFYKLPRRVWRKTKRYATAVWMAARSNSKRMLKFAKLSHWKPKVFLEMVKVCGNPFHDVSTWYKILS